MNKKLKSLAENETWYFSILLVLVGVTAFGLGKWSVLEKESPATQKNAEVTFYPTTTERLNKPILSNQTQVVASRSGTRYHRPECPGAAQIKPDNLINFSSIALARAAGYTAASNCPGLE